MIRMPRYSSFLLIAGLCAPCFPLQAQTVQEKQEVKAFLSNWSKTGLVEHSEIEKLRRFGKNALPLLAEFLPDRELGFNAQFAMDELDPVGATPYKLKNLLNAEPNQQRQTFGSANLALQQFEWSVRAKKSGLDTNNPPSPYPVNSSPYPFTKEIHDAALVRLEKMSQLVGIEEEAIKTLGLTGTKHDIKLLKEYGKKFPEAAWLSVMSAAKLGDRDSLKLIETELKKPVVTIQEQGWAVAIDPKTGENIDKRYPKNRRSEPGTLVSELASAQKLRTAMQQAAFTMNRKFVPLIASHLNDPRGQFHGDYSDPDPSSFAREALGLIVLGDRSQRLSSNEWKQKLKLRLDSDPESKP